MKDEKFLMILVLIICFAFSACQNDLAENKSLPIPETSPSTSPTPVQNSEEGIRKLDFRNFTYPWTKTFGTGEEKTFTLENGEKKLPNGEKLLLRSVTYGSLNDDGKDEAIVTVSIESGNATYKMLFVYTMDNDKSELLESFEFPEWNSLATAFVAHSELVIEVFKKDGPDPECCPSVLEITNYQWYKDKFVMRGEPQKALNNYVERIKKNRK